MPYLWLKASRSTVDRLSVLIFGRGGLQVEQANLSRLGFFLPVCFVRDSRLSNLLVLKATLMRPLLPITSAIASKVHPMILSSSCRTNELFCFWILSLSFQISDTYWYRWVAPYFCQLRNRFSKVSGSKFGHDVPLRAR
jgi:hypothetical protein